MDIDLAALPDDVETLQRLVRLLVAERADIAEAEAEITRLKLVIEKLQRSQFGRRAEQLDPDQLSLALEDTRGRSWPGRGQAAASERQKKAATRVAAKPSDHLPREDVRVDLDHDACPCCGGALRLIGESVSEMLDYVPARLRVIRIRRPRYGCRGCESIHQAPAPDRPIAKGLASAGLLAQVLVAKYCDHLPLYRQSQLFARQGVELDRSTLANWVGGAVWWLEPLHRRLGEHLFASGKNCSPMARRSRCSIPAAAGRRPGGFGSMRAMTGHGPGQIRQRRSTSTARIGGPSVPPHI